MPTLAEQKQRTLREAQRRKRALIRSLTAANPCALEVCTVVARSQPEVATRHGCARQNVSQLERSALWKVRSALRGYALTDKDVDRELLLCWARRTSQERLARSKPAPVSTLAKKALFAWARSLGPQRLQALSLPVNARS